MKSNFFELNSIIYKKQGTKKQTYQDRMNSKTFDDGISIVALADGLGSKSKSDIGAEIAVETAIETLHEVFANRNTDNPDKSLAEDVKISLLDNIRNQILLEAITADTNKVDINKLKEYSCTLLFTVMKDNKMFLGQMGDGYIVTKRKDGSLKLVFSPKNDNTEYANGTETIFSSSKCMRLACGNREDFEYIFLSSDGTDKMIRGDWRGEYTPFITGKNHGRMPNVKLFEYMETLLKESKTGSVTPKMYSDWLTNDIASMLIDNRVDDDVTFAFVNTNIKGPTLKVTDMVEAIRQEKMKNSSKAKENELQK